MAHDGEKLNLLTGKQAELTDKDVVITDGERAIGLGGVMGGVDTEVDENTKNIIIECANFDMYAIRRTSMRHGLFTDAVTRFNKGQSPLQNLAVLAKIVDDIQRDNFGQIASEVVDDNHLPDDMLQRGSVHVPVNVGTDFINTRLGLGLGAEEIKTLLENVEFSVDTDDKNLTVKAPFWRTDIEIPEDIVEEVGRLYGYDRLPLVLPKRDIAPAQRNVMIDLKSNIRRALSRAGANEVLTYSFVHGNLLERAGQDPERSFQITNALSPDLQYYRQSVLPSLLDKVHPNLKAGYDEFAIFEIGKGHWLDKIDAAGLPAELEMLDFVYAANDKLAKPGAAYYQARTYLQQLAAALHLEIELKQADQQFDDPVARPFDLSRSAFVFVKGTDQILGMIGEIKPGVRKSLKLPTHTAAFNLNMDQLLAVVTVAISGYQPLSRYPGTSQDICLRVSSDTAYAAVYETFETVLQDVPFDWGLEPVDIYQSDDKSTKQITIRVTLNNPLATLTSNEVQSVVSSIVGAATANLNAQHV
jgi:phenylalanyl-tRNA synthetase beta chain